MGSNVGRPVKAHASGPTGYTQAEMKIRANAFAMELLMPRGIFLKEADKVTDWNDEGAVKRLADHFKVTIGVAVRRAIELDHRSSNHVK